MMLKPTKKCPINHCSEDDLANHLKCLEQRLDYLTRTNYNLAKENQQIKNKMKTMEKEKQEEDLKDLFLLGNI